ncbi:hypothetical protein SAMN02745117_02234 [Lampropedia hyalina DSM 16112]|uniref:Uncharacterized protein n=1 Tax=Lampropedia hyalina DSM 16112 TaxID=1122156 RepID=A0A1M5CTG0_9BURK|nr:hypothetical protein SAMN02745117_02234 [Lampropedia hyalina DSM 16112]
MKMAILIRSSSNNEGCISEDADQLHFKYDGMSCQRMIEIEQDCAIFTHLQGDTSEATLALGHRELHYITQDVFLIRIAHLIQQCTGHPLQQFRFFFTKCLALGQFDGGVSAFWQSD